MPMLNNHPAYFKRSVTLPSSLVSFSRLILSSTNISSWVFISGTSLHSVRNMVGDIILKHNLITFVFVNVRSFHENNLCQSVWPCHFILPLFVPLFFLNDSFFCLSCWLVFLVLLLQPFTFHIISSSLFLIACLQLISSILVTFCSTKFGNLF